jgi:hypothetical protein
MNDYDGIKNYNNLKYSQFEIFDNFWFYFLMIVAHCKAPFIKLKSISSTEIVLG